MASIEQRDGKWRVRWKEPRPGGGWTSRTFTVGTKREAKKVAVEAEQAVRAGRTYEPGPARETAGLRQMMAAYMHHSARVHAPKTTIRVGQHLDLFERFLRAGRRRKVLSAGMLSYQTLSAFHAWLQDPQTGRHVHRRGEETCRKVVSAVEVFWSWAYKRQQRGDWSGVPYPDSLELKRAPRLEVLAPTWDQVDAMLLEASGWHRQLYTVLRCTGLRVAQAMAIRWEDIDLEAQVLHVRVGKSRQEKRGRWVPLAPVLVEEIAGWGERAEWLVPCPRKQREARARDAARAWTRAKVPEQLWAARPHHALRKCFRTELIAAGASPAAVDHLMGHAHQGVGAQVYTDPRAFGLREAVAMVPAIGAGNVVRLRAEEG